VQRIDRRGAVDADANPYVPGFGVIPPALAGREPEFADLEAALRRVRRGFYEQPRLVSGDRGMGKTAVVAELATEAAEAGVWSIQLEAHRTTSIAVPLLRSLERTLRAHDADARAGAAVRSALAVLSGFAVTYAGLELDLELVGGTTQGRTGDLATDLTDLFTATATAARRAGTALLLVVDEVHAMPAEQLAPLFSGLQAVARANPEPGRYLPLLAVVAGLPHSRAHLRRASSTYAERIREHALGPLAEAATAEALTVPAEEHGVRWEAEALATAVTASGGYPYFVQLVGYECWRVAAAAGARSVVRRDHADAGIAAARTEAERVYASRVAEVPDTERAYLQAAAALPEGRRRSGEIAAALGGSAADYGWARERLIERGLLRPDGHGRVAFTLPGLAEWLRAHG
jgi:hypothetical protein